MEKNRYNQNIIEELANSITHGFGFGLSVIGFIVLMVLANADGDPWKIAAFSIYGASLTILYLTSTLYHSISHSRLKAIFRRLDHSAIYLLIAGTYTPIILISLKPQKVDPMTHIHKLFFLLIVIFLISGCVNRFSAKWAPSASLTNTASFYVIKLGPDGRGVLTN